MNIKLVKNVDDFYHARMCIGNVTVNYLEGETFEYLDDNNLSYHLIACHFAHSLHGSRIIHNHNELCPYCGLSNLKNENCHFAIAEVHHVLQVLISHPSFRLHQLLEDRMPVSAHSILEKWEGLNNGIV